KAIRVSVLLLSLTGAARAGEIIIPPAPNSATANCVQEVPANSEDSVEETVTLTGIALAVLLSLLP
ncbi:MAG TPA: hypothetical protein VD968_07615, partial [Pyrinomonadaceae bacterium]|nr:hypothetical protein [Pyrinomonadaceae bacterium]